MDYPEIYQAASEEATDEKLSREIESASGLGFELPTGNQLSLDSISLRRPEP
jgi:hypothetical protein